MRLLNSTMSKSVLTFLLFTFIGFSQIHAQELRDQTIKYQNLIALVDAFYVDSVSIEKLTEDAIIKVLAELDPHSVYISKDEVKAMNEPLQGSFSGVGIQFNILRDTLMVVATIPGGPSEKAGLRASDRIIKIDGESCAGVGMKNPDVFKKLRGDKGTKVNLEIQRKGESELLDFLIVRDDIPIYSLDASYMINKSVGYIKLNRFAAKTADEFIEALIKLKGQNMQDLILDLRGNGGGYMTAAIKIVDQLFNKDQLIVFTEGLKSMRHENVSTDRGIFKEGRLVVLIDEGSASASEIVSGAIQDWDRGLIVGRRSFGKGLVQRQFPLSDGSMIRLTTAHYHTPTGRFIQKPYDNGLLDYHMDIINRYKSGEMVSPDSIHFPDSLKYKTLLKQRIVYGGGGIMPDVFVPIDTTANYKYFNLLARKNVLYPFVLTYMDSHREKLKAKYPDFKSFNKNFHVTEEMLKELLAEGDKAGVEHTEKEYLAVKENLKVNIKATIARDLWDGSEFYQVSNQKNEILEKALEILDKPKEYEKYLK
ncbi:S41 family peptidase [Ancylomarina sp. 16SWW S1-10-2]|uniref:S41 family peptidase n=1 Tax=Ancylomarina sp. 16SWW S1-10-2 TaxID=2499681 RepID=UPI001E501534|nr:S41 family peptidase [Ancylomarina sp. 16SWW S1-10-2]